VHFLLTYFCLTLGTSQEVSQVDGGQTTVTIKEVQLGLEALTTFWHTREMHFVRTPFAVMEDPIDHPGRIQGVVIQGSTGQYLIDAIAYRDGNPMKRYVFGFDGNACIRVEYVEPLPRDPTTATITAVDVTATSQVAVAHYPNAYDLFSYEFKMSYAELLKLPSAKVVGTVSMNSNSLLRVEVILPPKDPVPFEQRLVLDVDVVKEFWPRRVAVFAVPDGTEMTSPIEFEDFTKVDGHWFPKKVAFTRPRHELVFVITKVVFNLPVSKDGFFPKVPDGTLVVDRRTGQSFVAGGDIGATLRREAAKNEVLLQQQQAKSVRVLANSRPWWLEQWWVFAFILLGVLALGTAFVLSRRNSAQKG